jgi:hypothetical protein
MNVNLCTLAWTSFISYCSFQCNAWPAETESCGGHENFCCDNTTCNYGLACVLFTDGDALSFRCKVSGCGLRGQPCCEGGITCLDRPTDRCMKGKCLKVDCGGEGKECCEPLGPNISDFTGCNDGMKCTDGKCGKSGGGANNDCGSQEQTCCSVRTTDSVSYTCNSGLECARYTKSDTIRRVCKAPGCGKTGKECCKGTIPCLSGNLDCCTSGKCKQIDCGKLGKQCCPFNGKPPPDFTGCPESLECVKGKCAHGKPAMTCGKLKQKCCKGGKCSGRLACRKGQCQ